MNYFFTTLEKKPFIKKLLKEPLTYVAGAVLLSLLQIIHFVSLDDIWGVTTAFANWGAWFFELLGGDVSNWRYFSAPNPDMPYKSSFLLNGESIQNIGIIVGAFLSALFASQFKIKKIKSHKQVIAAVLGGLCMGYGARLAGGCNIGALYSAISAFSLAGWLFAFFVFIGAFFGSKLLLKYFI